VDGSSTHGRPGPRLQPVSREQHTGGNPRRPRVRGVADRVSAVGYHAAAEARACVMNVISSVTCGRDLVCDADA
jgi:hypothetical protein